MIYSCAYAGESSSSSSSSSSSAVTFQEKKRAFELTKKAAQKKYPDALLDLADYYYVGERGIVEKDNDKAAQYYQEYLDLSSDKKNSNDESQANYRVGAILYKKAESLSGQQKEEFLKKAYERFKNVKSGNDRLYAFLYILEILTENSSPFEPDRIKKIKIYSGLIQETINREKKVDFNNNLTKNNFKTIIETACSSFFRADGIIAPTEIQEYLKKSLILFPDNIYIKRLYWKLYEKYPQVIDFNEAFNFLKEILQDPSLKDPSNNEIKIPSFYAYGTILDTGYHDVPINKALAERYFKEILKDENSPVIDEGQKIYFGFMHALGKGVPHDLTKALSWFKQVGGDSADLGKKLVQQIERLIKKERKQLKKSSEIGQKIDEPSDSFESLYEDEEDIQEPIQTAETRVVGKDQYSLDLFIKDTKEYINNKYIVSDGSFVESIDIEKQQITVSDPENSLSLILMCQPGDPSENFLDKIYRKKLRKLNYDPRVQKWFSQDCTGDYHCFGMMVDCLIQVYGKPYSFSQDLFENKKSFFIPGIWQDSKTGKKQSGQFEYSFYKDRDESWKVYHRFFKPYVKASQ